jgi:(p)ppGpp synthase/HD superfamily hydrolase
MRLTELLIVEMSEANLDAKKLGLEYYGFGKYGKDKKVSHHTVDGKLEPVESYDVSTDNDTHRALDFAANKHDGQTRKATGDAYIEHPKAVAEIVKKYKESQHESELVAAALCHDTLEDTETTFVELANNFGPMVASLVNELTNDPKAIAAYGKLEYHKKKLVALSSYGLVIKLADRLHNINDHPTSKMIDDTVELMDHLEKNRMLTETQKKLMQDIVDSCKKKK